MAPGIIITRTLEIFRLLRHMLEMFASPAASENKKLCVWTTKRWGNNDLMFSNMFQQDRTACYDTLFVVYLKNVISIKTFCHL